MRWEALAAGDCRPRNREEAIASASGPLSRVIEIADSPGAVAGATIVSFATFAGPHCTTLLIRAWPWRGG
jgi:hypothetical protein